MPYIDVDIDVDEFVNACSQREIKELINILKDDGHLHDPESNSLDLIDGSLEDSEWNDVLKKLAGIRLQMSVEDIAQISKIARKY
jgi:hypothetical protein